MCLDHIHFLPPSNLPSTPVQPPIKQTPRKKGKTKWTNKKREKFKNLIMEASVWHSESCCIPLCPYISTWQTFIAESLVWCEALGLDYTNDAPPPPTRTIPGHPAAALCCGHPADLGLRVRFLQVLICAKSWTGLASESGVFQKKYDQFLIASTYACVSTLR